MTDKAKELLKRITAVILLVPLLLAWQFVLSFGKYRIGEHFSYHDCVCDEALTFREYASSALAAVGNVIFPQRHSEQELTDTMNEAFSTQFTVVKKEKFRGEHIYVMSPAFDPSLEVRVTTWSDYSCYDGDKIRPVIRKRGEHNYCQAVIEQHADEIKALAEARGIKIEMPRYFAPATLTAVISSYNQLEDVAALFTEINSLLALRGFTRPKDPESGRYILSCEDSAIFEVRLDESVYGYMMPFSKMRYSVDWLRFTFDNAPVSENILSDLQRSYILTLERNYLQDPSAPTC